MWNGIVNMHLDICFSHTHVRKPNSNGLGIKQAKTVKACKN
jgi:hypothetical protein